MDTKCNKSAEVNGGTPFAEARGYAATIAEAILAKWTLCQALGDNGEYYPCPGDEDDQMAELTIVIEDALKPKPKPQNDGTQRPGSPDGSLATETRKPGSLK